MLSAKPAVDKAPDLSVVAKYRDWTLANQKPHRVYSAAAVLCAAPINPPKDPSPHADKYIRVFVNHAGRNVMMNRSATTFPRGTMIVKQKLAAETSVDPELLTVMIKREAGYDKSHGDWEYAVFDGPGSKLTRRGKLENCRGCHAKQARIDYVFRTYLTDQDRKAYKHLTAGIQPRNSLSRR
jgi:hypothetical protein